MSANKPNVVFILVDQHRWDFMGYESNGTTFTPNLDQIASEGVAFSNAYCTSPLCSPSRAAIASGQMGISSGCFTNLHEIPPGTPSFVSQLRGAGYRTSALGKTHMEIHAYDSDLTADYHREFMDSLGWDDICEVSGSGMMKAGIVCAYSEFLKDHGLFDEALAFKKQWGYFMNTDGGGLGEFECREWTLAEKYHESCFIADRSMDWLRQNAADGPFFIHVGFAAPHSPIEPVTRFMDLYREGAESEPWGVDSCPDYIPDGRRGYRAMITQVDEYVGRIRALLDEMGVLENTIIIYTADHGEMAGDFDLTGKTRFFEASVRVPLIVQGPGVKGGRKSDAFVSLLDIGRTIDDLCSVAPHNLDEGQSLAPVLSGETDSHRDWICVEMGCDRMAFDGRYKLMWGDPGLDARDLGRLHLDKPINIPPSPPRLYDLENDPHELRDIVDDPSSKSIIDGLLDKLGTRTLGHVVAQPCKSRGEYNPL